MQRYEKSVTYMQPSPVFSFDRVLIGAPYKEKAALRPWSNKDE